MIRGICTLAAAMIVCTGCGGNNLYEKLEAERLNAFRQTPVTLPENLISKGCGGVTDTALLSRPLKMVIYVNARNCLSCSMQFLVPYYIFMLENRNLESFAAIFILQPSDMKAAEKGLEDIRLRHTVFFDPDGSFPRLNPHWPEKDARYSFFLMDRDNNVLLVGDPLHDKKLMKRYLKTMKKYDKLYVRGTRGASPE